MGHPLQRFSGSLETISGSQLETSHSLQEFSTEVRLSLLSLRMANDGSWKIESDLLFKKIADIEASLEVFLQFTAWRYANVSTAYSGH